MKLSRINALFILFLFRFMTNILAAREFRIDDYLEHSLVFFKGEDGYHNYRIPSVAVAPDGTLISVIRNESF